MSLDLILLEIQLRTHAAPHSNDIALLRDLVAAIRPQQAHDSQRATDNLRALCYVLHTHPDWRQALRHYLIQILVSRQLVHLLTDTGITLNNGFWGAGAERLMNKFLPPLVNDDYIKDVFGQIFDHHQDYIWVNAVEDGAWQELFESIGFRTRKARHTHAVITQQLLSALQVLSYRITNIGLEAELVRNHPDIEKFESPFLRQNDAINDYVTSYRAWMLDRNSARDDAKHIDILLSQCEEIASRIRRTAAVSGVSVSLTRLLLRLKQCITRLRQLLGLLDSRNWRETAQITIQLFKELVSADNQRHSLRELMQTSTELLSLQVTDRAGKSGEHYVTNTRAEWFAMLQSAMGAGFIVGFMALIKILAGGIALAPFGYALLYSLNYSSGFMLVHVLHWTIATKQPAMTAALIARAIDEGKQQLDELAELVVRVFRSQWIAIIGNVGVAMPTAFVIAWSWYGITGHHLVTVEKAGHLLHDLDPLRSLALPHAAIAGVCLFLSGLISGYYDNKASYSNIPARLRQLKWLKRLLGQARLQHVTEYIGNNLGALAGNFFFGIMLGSIGQFGNFFGLPVDIRHITFSSANFAFSLAALDNVMPWQTALYSLFGILCIGLVNLGVSFSLALMVALRSRRVSFVHGGTLIRLLWRRFCGGTRDFFLPAKKEAEPPTQ
ncbi:MULTISPECIES: site-specific recombinase [unclassified Undibacterium]|uniref:site-specific recombinase n=1 Tax=unclassified Undibacterium TaxID=2630295 RepID=UPI002AC8C61B|nr:MULTISPECIES: site-specific recombinase [unclassified Undibacterium]MEB0137444.1 site-specific recombinase [Undibacterium sp. CCC2.1]MEB0170891.1 site-specific recombinase [Undibacterium sp. CCC1.1]MEB0174843.1 site-specific recombinase [Undibacterium sp. CCC3.4]MEB0214179.1 site-specific recombinase [Undibacterium sp. 5I2]WPX44490.1 site-specific recombinase [Undibacterium sp. CCC3.4]